MPIRLRMAGRLPGKREFSDMERKLAIAVTAGVTGAAEGMQTEFRQSLMALGPRWAKLGRAMKTSVYPRGRPSLGAAALIYARGESARTMLRAHEDGVTIQARGGKALAIPVHNYRGPDRKLLGPRSSFFARRLRYIPARDRSGLAVGVLAVPATGTAAQQRRQRTAKVRRGLSPRIPEKMVAMFILVRLVRLPKRIEGKRIAAKWAADVPALITVEARRMGLG